MKALIHSPRTPLRQLAAVLLTALASGSAMAQWQWVDATGRKVYSDTAPPRSVPEKNILKRPSATAPQAASGAPAQSELAPPAPPVPAAQPSGVDPRLEAKRKAAEKAEEAQRQADQDKRNKARAENCERAKRSLATLNAGGRIRTTNAKGESVIMDDAARSVETKRVEGIVQSECATAPVQQVNPKPRSIP